MLGLWAFIILLWHGAAASSCLASFQVNDTGASGEVPHCMLEELDALVTAPRRFQFPGIGVVVGYEYLRQLGELEFTFAVPSTGWFGFGISETGSMVGADMLVMERGEDGSFFITDRYSKAFAEPVLDKVQNWRLLSASTVASKTSACAVPAVTRLVVRRLAKTCDAEDEELGPAWLQNYFIAAYGASGRMRYHGALREVTSHYFFLAEPIVQADLQGSPIRLPAPEITVPAGQTQYCYVRVDFPCSVRVHAWQVFGTKNLHHMHLMRLEGEWDSQEGYQCSSYIPGSIMVSWGLGDARKLLPNNLYIDLPAGSYVYEAHFENPQHDSFRTRTGFQLWAKEGGRHDSSKEVRVSALDGRWHDLLLPGETVRRSFAMPSSCMEAVPRHGLTVVGALGHMHYSGASIRAYRTRGGRTEMVFEQRHFDFNRQAVIYKPFKLMPGDSLSWECTFNLAGVREAKRYGLASTDEMCEIFIASNPPLPFARAVVGIDSGSKTFGSCSRYCFNMAECQEGIAKGNGSDFQEVPRQPALREVGAKREPCQLLVPAEAGLPFNNWILPHSIVLQLLVAGVLHMALLQIYLRVSKADWEQAVKRSLNVLAALMGSIVGFAIALHTEWLTTPEAAKTYDAASEAVADEYALLSVCADLVGVVYLYELITRAASRCLRWDLLLHHFATLALVCVMRNALEFELAPQAYAGISAALLLHVVVDVPVLLLLSLRGGKRHRAFLSRALLFLGLLKLLCHLCCDLLALMLYRAIFREETMHVGHVSFRDWFKQAYNVERPAASDWSSAFDWTSLVRIILPVVLLLLLVTQFWTTLVLMRIARQDLRKSVGLPQPAPCETGSTEQMKGLDSGEDGTASTTSQVQMLSSMPESHGDCSRVMSPPGYSL